MHLLTGKSQVVLRINYSEDNLTVVRNFILSVHDFILVVRNFILRVHNFILHEQTYVNLLFPYSTVTDLARFLG